MSFPSQSMSMLLTMMLFTNQLQLETTSLWKLSQKVGIQIHFVKKIQENQSQVKPIFLQKIFIIIPPKDSQILLLVFDCWVGTPYIAELRIIEITYTDETLFFRYICILLHLSYQHLPVTTHRSGDSSIICVGHTVRFGSVYQCMVGTTASPSVCDEYTMLLDSLQVMREILLRSVLHFCFTYVH